MVNGQQSKFYHHLLLHGANIPAISSVAMKGQAILPQIIADIIGYRKVNEQANILLELAPNQHVVNPRRFASEQSRSFLVTRKAEGLSPLSHPYFVPKLISISGIDLRKWDQDNLPIRGGQVLSYIAVEDVQ
ncbi:Hypothetical predicted protein, partial [Paramuricea clavata]